MPPWHIDRHVGIIEVQGRSVADAMLKSRPSRNGSMRARRRATWPTCRRRAAVQRRGQVAHRQARHRRHVARRRTSCARNGPDEFYDVDRRSRIHRRHVYRCRRDKARGVFSFKVVHHATVNMIEDEEEDPVGFFFNEYALGKNGDIFPPDSGRLIKAGSKTAFQPAPAPERRSDRWSTCPSASSCIPKGRRRSTSRSRSTWATTTTSTSRRVEMARSDGYFRLPRPAVLSAFQPHMHNRGKAMCMEAIYPDIRADSARSGSGAHRDARAA